MQRSLIHDGLMVLEAVCHLPDVV